MAHRFSPFTSRRTRPFHHVGGFSQGRNSVYYDAGKQLKGVRAMCGRGNPATVGFPPAPQPAQKIDRNCSRGAALEKRPNANGVGLGRITTPNLAGTSWRDRHCRLNAGRFPRSCGAHYSIRTARTRVPSTRISIAIGGRTPGPETISPRTSPPSVAPLP